MTAPSLPVSAGCRLVAADHRTLPLRAVDVAVDAGGGLASVRLAQTFTNAFAEPLRVTYTLPLPADGAVVGFAFTVDGVRTVGRVARRAEARAAFEQALVEGRTAALLEQERTALFSQELGNVPAGAVVEVEVTVEQVLRFAAGSWEWRWPTVVAPRYLGGAGQTSDAERVTVDVDPAGAVPCSARLTVRDACAGAPTSPSHACEVGETVQIIGALDRDVVVRWPVAAPSVGARLEVARAEGDAYGWLTLVPPAADARPVARDVCLLLDTSGSMGGKPLAQLKAFARGVVEGLRDADRLELIAFSSTQTRWRPSPAAIDARARADALAWIDALRAAGGTAMDQAIVAALAPLRPDAERQVVLVTDGLIGFEGEVLRQIRAALPAGARLHTVAIGSAPNRTLTRGAARAGGGYEAFVGPDEPAEAAVAELLARAGDPLWVDVRVSGAAALEHAPAVIPDLLAGSPARIALRLRPEGGELTVTARTAGGVHEERLTVEPIPAGEGRRVVATRFARERIEDLELERVCGGSVDGEVEALGLAHQIATRLTSWVAIGEALAVDPGDPTRTVNVPQAAAYAMSAEGVGLRAALHASAPVGALLLSGGPVDPEAIQAVLGNVLRRRVRREAPPPPASAPRVLGPRRLRAVIRGRREGSLVLEVVLDGPTRWDPALAVVVGATGAAAPAVPLAGTTRAGALQGGQTLRIVLAWTGADPVRIELPELILEIT